MFIVTRYVRHNKVDKASEEYVKNKTLYKVWLYLFDAQGARFKRGKSRSRFYTLGMNIVFPILYNRTTLDERHYIYDDLNAGRPK